MEEEKSKLETLNPEPRQGSGSMLAAARKQQKRTIEEIAQELILSLNTVKSHARNIYSKLGVKNRSQAISFYFSARRPVLPIFVLRR